MDYVCRGGEDYAEVAQLGPSGFYFIGTGNKAKETDFAHHHSRFNIDEDTLSTGVELHVRNTLNYFEKK
jgi:amidohydrolase